MNVVVHGLKDRRGFSTLNGQAGENTPSSGEIKQNQDGSFPSDGALAEAGSTTQCIKDIDTLVLQLQLSQQQSFDLSNEGDSPSPSAHFSISATGDIYYMADIAQALTRHGAGAAIYIEFACAALARHDLTARACLPVLTREAIIAGRRLVACLTSSIPSLKCVCRSSNMDALVDAGTIDRNTVQDLWVNIGAWATSTLQLAADRRACAPQARDANRGERPPWLLDSALYGG